MQLQVGLKQAGLKLEDVNVEVIATGAIVQALQADKVDAIVFSELRRYNLEADGVDVGMVRPMIFYPHSATSWSPAIGICKTKPKAVGGFNSRPQQSLQWIIDGHVDEALTIAIDNARRPGKASRLFSSAPSLNCSFPRSGRAKLLRRRDLAPPTFLHGRRTWTSWLNTRWSNVVSKQRISLSTR